MRSARGIALRASNNFASGYWRAVDAGGAAPGMRFFEAERGQRDRRRGGQHHRNIERDGRDAEQAAAGSAVLAVSIRMLRQAVIGMAVDRPVAMLVHCASVRMRLCFGLRAMNVKCAGGVFQAMRVAAKRHGRVRGENAKRIEHGERECRRAPVPPDRFENPQHSRIFTVPWPLRIGAKHYKLCRLLPIAAAGDHANDSAFMPSAIGTKARLDAIFVQMRCRLDAQK
jgi:hypothetical protein